jgi:plasmid stabilization system protein ParE
VTAVRIDPAAYADVDAAAARLEAARPGAGARLTAAFRRAVAAILTQPRGWAEAADAPPGVEVREYFIARYQYRVIYTDDGSEAVIVAVFHAARRPGTWHRRLPDPNTP